MLEPTCNAPGCTNTLPRHKRGSGHRPREYCAPACRQRAWRAKNKDKHTTKARLDQMYRRHWWRLEQERIDEERMLNRETWKRERREMLLKMKDLEDDRDYYNKRFREQLRENLELEVKLDEKDEEIARLQYLLDEGSKRKRKGE